MLNFFSEHVTYLMVCAGILGLVIGSFLNVVIYRLPLQLFAGWRQEAREFLGLTQEPEPKINLLWPASYCPQCRGKLRFWHNIPVVSYLFLKARCAYCRQPISWRYLGVELLTAMLTLIVFAHYPLNAQLIAALIFTWSLIPLTFIDFEHQLLPDDIVLPLLWLGLLLNCNALFCNLPSAVIGAVAGYLSLWTIAKLFELITGKVGMGHGDFKLFGVIGAWLGWQVLPLIILLASLVGAIVGISLILLKQQSRDVPIPFGPYLACAGWLGLLFYHQLFILYVQSILWFG